MFHFGKPISKEADDMKSRFARRGTIIVAATVLVGLLSMPVSVAAESLVLDEVASLGAVQVPDEECQAVDGEGLVTGLTSGLISSLARGVSYVAECALDAIGDRLFGDDGDNTSFQPRTLCERMLSGFIGGFLGGLISPGP